MILRLSVRSGRVLFVRQRLRAKLVGAGGPTPPSPPAKRPEVQFFAALPHADRALAVAWWVLLLLNGVLPPVFAVATGVMVGALQRAEPLLGPLVLVGVSFVGLLVVSPIQTAVSMNLGSKMSTWLNDGLIRSCVDPPGIGHLEDADLADDLTTARDFDLRHDRPADVISTRLHRRRPGRADRRPRLGGGAGRLRLVGAAAAGAGRWGSTHWLLRESGVWRDRNTDEVKARPARTPTTPTGSPSTRRPAKELRLFGLARLAVERFTARRLRLHELQYRRDPAPRALGRRVPADRRWPPTSSSSAALADWRPPRAGSASTSWWCTPRSRVGASAIAFGGLNWALDGAAAPVAAVARLGPAMAPPGALSAGVDARPRADRRRRSGFRDVSLHLPRRRPAGARRPRPDDPGRVPRWPSSARTAPARPPWPSCSAGSTTRDSGAIEVDGVDLRDLDLDGLAAPGRGGVPGLRALRAAPARQRRPGRRATTTDVARRARRTPARDRPGRPRHRRWPRATRAAPTCRAASGSGSRWPGRSAPVRLRRRRRAPRRADRPARRPRRGRDLRPGPGRDPALHHDPDLPPVLHRPARRPHLRRSSTVGWSSWAPTTS